MTAKAVSRWKWTVVSLRYTFGYLCAAFLVSAPLTLIIREREGFITFSLAYGGILGLCALLFVPLGDIDWKHVPVPQFKMFELGVCRNAAVLAALLYLGRILEPRYFPPVELITLVFFLMAFSYLRAKAHTLLFRNFYKMEEDKRIESLPTEELTREISWDDDKSHE